MPILKSHTDDLVTFAYRRWEELRDDAPLPAKQHPFGIAGQRSWELILHMYSAVEAKVEEIKWFAAFRSTRGTPEPPWLKSWKSTSPLLERADKLFSDRSIWPRLRLSLLDVQDIRHGMSHPTPTVFTKLPHQSGRTVDGMTAIDVEMSESRKKVDKESGTYPHTELPYNPLDFELPDTALAAAILVAVLAESNTVFDPIYASHTNGRAWGKGVQPDEWLQEISAYVRGPSHIKKMLKDAADSDKLAGSQG